MTKLCECGCGRPTSLITKNYPPRGMVRGEYRRFVQGHSQPHRHRTAETFQKIAAAHRGKRASEETKKKQSAAKFGKPTGRHLSPSVETRAKIASTLRGRTVDPEVSRRLSERLAGRPMPEAAMRALKDPAVQERRLAALRATFAARPKKQKPQPRVKKSEKPPQRTMSEAKRDWWSALSDEDRASLVKARSVGQKKRWAALSHDQKLTATAAARRITADRERAIWAALTPDQRRDKMRPVYLAALKANPSSIEITVRALLDSIGVAYTPQASIGRFTVDILIPEKRLVIECDGSYWHGLPGVAEKDAKRDEWLRRHGYDVLRLPEAEIKSGSVTERVKKAVA